MLSLQFNDKRLYLFIAFYLDGGGLAIYLYEREDYNPLEAPYHILTVNLPDAPLEPEEFCVKTWGSGEDIAQAARESGLFVDTGKRVPTGFVEAQVWRFVKICDVSNSRRSEH